MAASGSSRILQHERGETVATWTLMETVLSVTALGVVLLLSLVVG